MKSRLTTDNQLVAKIDFVRNSIPSIYFMVKNMICLNSVEMKKLSFFLSSDNRLMICAYK